MFLWEKACNAMVYVQNSSPHRILGDNNFEEAFTGVKLETRNLRIFCFPVYIHVTMEKKMKLEPSVEKDIFVGYNETSKDYKIFIPA
jgi:hypothetical protein